MLERPPDPDRRRQQAAERQRRKRERDHDGVRFYRVGVSPAVLAALIARSLDAELSEPEAERASLDRRRVSDDLSAVIEEWAARYLAKRDTA